jgi:hypothetical protein
MGQSKIDAYVTEVVTEVGPDREIRLADLPMKSHERLFYERVPLPAEARTRVKPGDPSAYPGLAEGVEAWGFRAMQARGEFLTREEVAEIWWREEYLPVVEMLREAGLATEQNETDAYLAVVSLRYLLLRTHEWDDEILERLREEMESSSSNDTEVRRLKRGLS